MTNAGNAGDTDARDAELDELEERIERTRRQAEEHGTIPEPDEQSLIDPDGDGDVDDFRVQPPG